MRFRLTLFLLILNAALFFGIWSLERSDSEGGDKPHASIAFSVLQIEGKNIEKPRILKLENNRWRIVSPIDWPANLFAVNRIKNQLEFLDKEASFSLDEVKKHGHSLSEYGLDDPAYVFKYGNEKKMYALKIGKSAPIGDRIYMLDENGNRIIVVDKEFVDSLIVDIERLRQQFIFEIPRFEVSAFSIRLSVETSDASGKMNFRRIGLIKDGGKWKFETPIVADADTREVNAFLDDICQLSASGFNSVSADNAGFDVSALPATITIQGTNRRQVLLLGGKTKDGSQVYAHLENNPTIFTLDASILKKISDIQTTLREKSFLRFDINQTVGIDISKDGKSLKLRKLKSGVWDVIGSGSDGQTLTSNADLALVNNLLSRLEKAKARQFVNDVPGENLAAYGLTPKCLHITVAQSDQTQRGIRIGSTYKLGGARLMYAASDDSDAVYGISMELSEAASTDFLYYRSRILEILPEKAVVQFLRIMELRNAEPPRAVFEIQSANGDFSKALSLLPQRRSSAAKTLLSFGKRFVIGDYLDAPFSDKGVEAQGQTYPWKYVMEVGVELPGTDSSTQTEILKWHFTKRLGGTVQYGGSAKSDAVYTLSDSCIDALFELTQEYAPPKSVEKPAPDPLKQ